MRELAPFIETAAQGGRKDAAPAGLRAALDHLGVRVQIVAEHQVGQLFDAHARGVVKANGQASEKLIGIPAARALGPDLTEELAKRRKENVDLVVNAQRAYAAGVQEIFDDPDTHGLTVEELQARLLERGDVSESRAELIARDQTLKLNGAINEIRQTDAGIDQYTWSTSLDERVREEHAALEGRVFSWDDPPEVGHPGEDFQCRCIALPVIPGLDEPAEGEEPVAGPQENTSSENDRPTQPVPVAAEFSLGDFDPNELREEGIVVRGSSVETDVFASGRAPADAAAWSVMYAPGPGYTSDVREVNVQSARSLSVTGDILDTTGNKIGGFDRTFMRERGDLIAKHDSFFVLPAHQGGGIGARVTKAAFESYERMGVKEVRVSTVDVGKYTWARFGFSWPVEEGAKRAVQLERFLIDQKGVDPTEAKKMASAALDGAPDVARLTFDGQKVGKEFLLSAEGWSGSIRIDPNDHHYQMGKKRLGMR